MIRRAESVWQRLAIRVYAVVLRAYPAVFRRRFGREMLQLFELQLRETRRLPRRSAAAYAARISSDVLYSLVTEWMAVEKGGSMRVATMTVTVFTCAAAVWLAVMENVLRHPGYGQRTANAIAIALLSTIVGVSTWLGLGVTARIMAGCTGGILLFVGTTALTNVVRASHFEGFALVIGAALIVQGILALWFAVRGRPLATTA